MNNPTQVSPFPTGSALNGDQGGTGLDATGTPAGKYITTTGNAQAPFQLTDIPAPPAPPGPKLAAVFSEQYPNNNGAPVGSASAFNQRALNTTLSNTIPGCSLAAHTVTLPAGTYHITGVATSNQYNASKLSLYSGISGTALLLGVSVNGPAQTSLQSNFEGILTVAGPTPIYLNQWLGGSVAGGTLSMGNPVNSGDPEVYSQLTIIQL